MSIIRISASDGGTFSAYLSTLPRARGHGVIVIQEIFGVNAGLRATVDLCAEHGYVALAPDLFWRVEPDDALEGRTDEDARRILPHMDWPSAVGDLDACVAYLRGLPQCTGHVASVGYCMGGRLAFMLSFTGSTECNVSIHGVGLEKLVDGAVGIRSPVQVHIGTADHLVSPEARDRIVKVLSRHPMAEVYEYEGAKHGFARPESRNFDEAASALAMERTFDFFERVIR